MFLLQPNLASAADRNMAAYAHVFPDGTLDANNSKNVTKMAGANGLYCFKLTFKPKTVVATLADDPTGGGIRAAYIAAAVPPTEPFVCSALPEANGYVATYDQSQSRGGYAFYVYWAR